MPKSLLEQKLKKMNDEQERRIEQAKKEIAKEYKENNHKYDNGKTAIFTTNRGKYCEICGQLILKKTPFKGSFLS